MQSPTFFACTWILKMRQVCLALQKLFTPAQLVKSVLALVEMNMIRLISAVAVFKFRSQLSLSWYFGSHPKHHWQPSGEPSLPSWICAPADTDHHREPYSHLNLYFFAFHAAVPYRAPHLCKLNYWAFYDRLSKQIDWYWIIAQD